MGNERVIDLRLPLENGRFCKIKVFSSLGRFSGFRSGRDSGSFSNGKPSSFYGFDFIDK